MLISPFEVLKNFGKLGWRGCEMGCKQGAVCELAELSCSSPLGRVGIGCNSCVTVPALLLQFLIYG